MKKWIFAVCIAFIGAAAAGIWYFLIMKDQREVRELVNNVTVLVGKKGGDLPHAGIFKHNKVDELFAEKIAFSISKPDMEVELSREDLKGRVALLLRMIDRMQVDAENIRVEVAGDAAVFEFDARVNGKIKNGHADFSDVYRCSGAAVKVDGRWLMSLLTAVPVVK